MTPYANGNASTCFPWLVCDMVKNQWRFRRKTCDPGRWLATELDKINECYLTEWLSIRKRVWKLPKILLLILCCVETNRSALDHLCRQILLHRGFPNDKTNLIWPSENTQGIASAMIDRTEYEWMSWRTKTIPGLVVVYGVSDVLSWIFTEESHTVLCTVYWLTYQKHEDLFINTYYTFHTNNHSSSFWWSMPWYFKM